MNVRHSARRLALAVVSVVVMAWVAWPVGAHQGPKNPLGYDVYDYWKSIGGARLSDDGQWFAYSLTSQAEDGELVVANIEVGAGIQTAARHRAAVHARQQVRDLHDCRRRRPRPTTTPRRAAPTPEPAPAPAGGGKAAPQRATNRNSVGIMSLPGGQVTTVEQIASFRLPAESSTWLAHAERPRGRRRPRRRGGRGGGGGAGGGGGGRQGGGAPRRRQLRRPLPAASRRQQPAAGRGAAPAAHRARKPSSAGNDLIVRNLSTGQDVTIPEVSRVRVGQERLVARLCRVVDRRDEGRRVRAQHERRIGRHAADRQGPLQEFLVR